MNSWDCAYPSTMGFSSSWSEAFNPDGHYRLTSRRQVGLVSVPAVSILTNGCCEVFLKTAQRTNVVGLSSGAGSSLYVHNGAVHKIKRNGYGGSGPVAAPYSYIALDVRTGEEMTRFVPYRGIMEERSALQEFSMLNSLRQDGFCPAYRPLDVVRYTIPNMHDSGYAVCSRVASDIRIDELIFALYAPILARELERATLVFDRDSGTFMTKKNNFFDQLDDTSLFRRLSEIGFVLGAQYRSFHDAGYLRGYPNSWFANEVVDCHGEISFVDMEFAARESLPSSAFRCLQQIEAEQARCALFSEFETIGLHLFAKGGLDLSTGFGRGYNRSSKGRRRQGVLSPSLLCEAFEMYDAVKSVIWGTPQKL